MELSIEADEFEFDKIKNILKAKGNIKLKIKLIIIIFLHKIFYIKK